MNLGTLIHRAKARWRTPAIWYHPAYRLPLSDVEGRTGLAVRRADLVAWYLLEEKLVGESALRQPARVSYADLARVHTPRLLDSLWQPETIARIFAADAADVPVDSILRTVRLGCGGTVEAARHALRERRPALNLLGGFHHAAPDRAAGYCAVNDIAVAVAVLRAEGLKHRIVVLDLDAHPPDGTAACLAGDPEVWMGSLSAADWGPLDRVDETVLPPGCRDDDYLVALARLLSRMPIAELAFVVAGGDVLAGDPLGNLAMSVEGIRRRDALVLRALGRTASVWLPGGGYHADAWRALAGTALVLAGRPEQRIPARSDPLSSRFAWLSASLDRSRLSDEPLTEEALAADLGVPGAGPPRLLGYYTAEGIELALERYGILAVLESLGYRDFRVTIGKASTDDQMRLYGRAAGREHLLIDCVLDRARVSNSPVLFVHWLELRHPLAQFGPGRPALPGQTVPGPGLAREAGELLGRVAARLELAGVAFRPSAYHVAYAARHHLRFVDPARQRRFEALQRQLAGVPLLEATRQVAEGRVTLDGVPFTWEPDVMCRWLSAPASRAEPRPAPDAP